MTQNANQFKQTVEKGDLISSKDFNVFTCLVKTGEATALVPGQPVKLVDIDTEIPTVTAITAITDEIFGYVPSNMRVSSYAADERVKIACNDTIMVMEASAAIASGATVENVISGQKVAPQSTGTPSGIALNKATADGDLIRVWVKRPETLVAFSAKTTTAYSAGAGALPVTQDVIFLTTGGAEALTLADGILGQELIIIMVSDGGAGTLTPANYGNGNTLTFDDDGGSAQLIFDGTNWWNVGTPTATVA